MKVIRSDEHEDLDSVNKNAPCHGVPLAREILNINYMASLPHFHYSLDLTPTVFHIFLKMNMHLKRHHFNTAVDIKSESQKVFDSLTENDFQTGFQMWREP